MYLSRCRAQMSGLVAHKRTYGRLARPIRHICITMPKSAHRTDRSILFSLSFVRSPSFSLLYYTRVWGAVYSDIMAHLVERERKTKAGRARDGKAGAKGEKKVLQLSVSAGVLLFTRGPLNRVRKILKRSSSSCHRGDKAG